MLIIVSYTSLIFLCVLCSTVEYSVPVHIRYTLHSVGRSTTPGKEQAHLCKSSVFVSVY